MGLVSTVSGPVLTPSLSVIEIPLPTEFNDATSTPGWTALMSLSTSCTVVAPARFTVTLEPSRRSIVMSAGCGVPLESVVLSGTPSPEFRLLNSVDPVIVRMPRLVASSPPFSPMERVRRSAASKSPDRSRRR